MKKNRRAQTPKARRSAQRQREVLELRSSNAAQPHRSNREYRREVKHRNRRFIED